MSDQPNSENKENQHSALSRLWPSDTEESKKLAEEKQQKRQNLTELGGLFKQAREALGYNISDLHEHTGLSFTELEALEQGQFQYIEQQDYVDYYVHTYAALLGLNADDILVKFQQSFHQTDDSAEANAFDIQDEAQYEDAFAEEAKKTLEALNASGVNVLDNAADQFAAQTTDEATASAMAINPNITSVEFESPNSDPILEQNQSISQNQSLESNHFQNQSGQEPITSSGYKQDQKSFPWFKLIASFSFVLVVAALIYFVNEQYNPSNPTTNDDPNVASLDNVNNDANANNNGTKDADRVPEAQKAKKIGQLESKVINQGSTDLNAPTAEMVQKPLTLIGEQATQIIGDATDAVQEAATPIADAIGDVIDSEAAETIVDQAISDDLAKASELAKAAEATKTAVEEAAEQVATALPEPETAQLPEDPIQEALSQLPEDPNKYSLHATANNWVLIEDDTAQIIFSDELTPEKIITLPKVSGVIISLGDAGLIEVYKGKTLIGKLGEKDESLDLVSLEDRFNQITN